MSEILMGATLFAAGVFVGAALAWRVIERDLRRLLLRFPGR